MTTNKDNVDETLQPKHIDYALDALDASDRSEVEHELSEDEKAQAVVSELSRISELLEKSATNDPLPEPSSRLRQVVLNRLDETETTLVTLENEQVSTRSGARIILASSACLLLALLSLRVFLPEGMVPRDIQHLALSGGTYSKYQLVDAENDKREQLRELERTVDEITRATASRRVSQSEFKPEANVLAFTAGEQANRASALHELTAAEKGLGDAKTGYSAGVTEYSSSRGRWTGQTAILQDSINEKNKEIKEIVASEVLELESEQQRIKSYIKEVEPLESILEQRGEIRLAVTPRIVITHEQNVRLTDGDLDLMFDIASIEESMPAIGGFDPSRGESYESIVENSFVPVAGKSALSTFSIDVDTASYSSMRRYLRQGQLPPPSAVRIEELVNYFQYDYPQPQTGEPFSVSMEVAECPWKPSHQLLRVGLKGREIPRDKRPPSNLVFLIDVSGSMSNEDKLPLLKESMKMLVGELDERDRVTIVTYAGDAGLQLEPTSGDEKIKIREVIDSLKSGGSTHGSAGIQLAYEKAAESFIDDGTNRVILATDGDLNVGITDDDVLVELIKDKAASGVFLTVLGFGTGNLQDSKLEKLADNGNGMYAYIDSLREGRRVLVEQIMGSLVTIAKDVKIQIEFNPATIGAYRLIGYENRILAAEDFDNDKKDAGEIGAGHTVTALYELVPAGMEVEGLKYQPNSSEEKTDVRLSKAAKTGELLTLALRYKKPDGDKSKRIEYPLKDSKTKFNRSSKDFQFAAAVASFGMLLRNSEYCGSATLSATEEIASGAIGKDASGYRAEFLDLVRRAEEVAR